MSSCYLTQLDKKHLLYRKKRKVVNHFILQREDEDLIAYSLRFSQMGTQNHEIRSIVNDFYRECKDFVRSIYERWTLREEIKYLQLMFEIAVLILPWDVYYRTQCLFGSYIDLLKATEKRSFLFTLITKCMEIEHLKTHELIEPVKALLSSFVK
jgi:hypothetical protein